MSIWLVANFNHCMLECLALRLVECDHVGQAQWELSSSYAEPNLSVWPIKEDAGDHRLVPRLIVVFQRQLGVVDVCVQHLDSSVANVSRCPTFE